MKRKRGILYEVFSLGGADAGVAGATPGGRRRPGGGVIVSRELALVAALLVVVFLGTSYYLGTLRGRTAEETATLSVRSRDGSGPPAPETATPQRAVDRFYAVRVFTYAWDSKSGPEAVERKAEKLCRHLEAQGFADVLPLKNSQNRELYIYVGRSGDPDELRDLGPRLTQVVYEGKKPFTQPFLAKVEIESP